MPGSEVTRQGRKEVAEPYSFSPVSKSLALRTFQAGGSLSPLEMITSVRFQFQLYFLAMRVARPFLSGPQFPHLQWDNSSFVLESWNCIQ